MSDESDSEEFYDADEQTPVRAPKLADIDKAGFSTLEEEERRLEEERLLAEERRRQEDEALRKRFEELQLLKEKQKQKEEALLRAQEHEKRRRKLEEMRQHMSDESSPRPPPKPPRAANEELESPSVSLPPSVCTSAASTSGSTYATPSISPDTEQTAAFGARPKVPSVPSINIQDMISDGAVNFNQPAPEKSPLSKSLEELTNAVAGPSSDGQNEEQTTEGTKEVLGEEPDIIQSVKSSSLTRDTVALPVAPPRRKRKNKWLQAEKEENAGNKPSTSATGGDEKENLDLETPTSTVYSLTKELERTLDLRRSDANSCHSLDMTLATKGSRLVTAMEEESAKAESATGGGAGTDTVSLSSSADTDFSDVKVTSLAGQLSVTGFSGGGSDGVLGLESNTEDKRDSILMTQIDAEQVYRGTQSAPGSFHKYYDAEDLIIVSAHEAPRAPLITIDEAPPMDKVKKMPPGEVFSMKVGTQGGEVPVNMIRPRTMSGSRFLTDIEILEQVTVLNLDTGEQVPLSHAEDKIPRCINPLSLHIMRRTKEYSSDSSLHKRDGSDGDESSSVVSGHTTVKTVKPIVKKGRRIKRMIGKTAKKLKMKADGVLHKDTGSSSDDDEVGEGTRRLIKVKASNSHKGPYDFDLLVPVQDIAGVHVGAVWTMKFSLCGRLLATGGQDNLLRVWVLKDHYTYFEDMKNRYNEVPAPTILASFASVSAATKQVSPAPSQDSLSAEHAEATNSADKPASVDGEEEEEDWFAPFRKRPLQVYSGHSADLLDISWSKNYFLLSASMDKTVRLWHVSRSECLCCFQHIDFVTAIAFHPKDDRYFLSGSLDGKLRLWSIPDKKVALWNEVSGHSKLITAANFCLNGEFAVVGTYDGRCVFYSTKQLKYFTQIHVRSTRGKNARGRKVTGIEPLPGEDKILVTSNDSRIRLYDLRDLTLTCKFKGCANNSSQIKAGFSHDGKYIVCGSEDHFVYIWRTQHEFYKFSSARRDRSDYWEGIKAHNAVVTTAIFAPVPRLIIKPQFEYVDSDDRSTTPDTRGEVLVSADFSGAIKVFINKFKPGS